jgi:hypothetical protein
MGEGVGVCCSFLLSSEMSFFKQPLPVQLLELLFLLSLSLSFLLSLQLSFQLSFLL